MNRYQHPVIEAEELEAVNQVLKSGLFSGYRANETYRLGGEAVKAFESEFKAYHNTKYAIAFSSATSALHAALIACGIGCGDEVVTTPFTFSASSSCIKMVEARPLFADIEDRTFNIDARKVISPVDSYSVKAILPVHLMGHPANMDSIITAAKFNGWRVIEDACQALGAEYNGKKVGTFGDCGVFSFNQSKPISVGDGGMLITDDDEIAEICYAVRNHGEVATNLNILGYNYRMGEMEAALGLAQFRKLDERNAHRIKLANHLTEALGCNKGLTPPYVAGGCKHVYYTYGVKVEGDKRKLQERLISKGAYFGLGDQKPLHLYPFYGGHKGEFSVTERVSKELMFTDIVRYPMTIEDVDEIAGVVNEAIYS